MPGCAKIAWVQPQGWWWKSVFLLVQGMSVQCFFSLRKCWVALREWVNEPIHEDSFPHSLLKARQNMGYLPSTVLIGGFCAVLGIKAHWEVQRQIIATSRTDLFLGGKSPAISGKGWCNVIPFGNMMLQQKQLLKITIWENMFGSLLPSILYKSQGARKIGGKKVLLNI